MASRSGNSSSISTQAGDVILVNTAALAIAGFVSFSLLIWEFICYIPAEIRLLKDFRKVELWRMPDPWAFILSRYSSFGFAIASLYTLSLKTDDCQLAASMSQVLSIGVVAASGVLVARRTIMLWGNDTAVATLLATMYAVMIASWIATTAQYRSRSSSLPLSKFGTNCALQAQPPWNPINYAASTVFFTLTLLLSIYRMAPRRADFVLNLGLTPINRGCIWYFLVNAVTSLALFIVAIDHPSWTTDVARRSAKPVFVVLVAAMSHRIYLNNQVDHAIRRKGLEEMTRPNPMASKADSRPSRWSFVPIRRKPVPFPTDLETVIQIYPRPPPPPPVIPTSPIPRQHIASLERSRKESQTSVATSSASSEIVFQSPSALSAKLPSSSATHGHRDSGTTNPPMSPSSAGIGSPTSVLSTIAFGSPPDSPAMLSFPTLGKQGRVAQEGRSSFGSVWTNNGGGSHPGTPRRGGKRLSSPRSGWVR